MKRRIKSKIPAVLLIIAITLIWAVISELDIVPRFMLPSPFDVFKAFYENFFILLKHSAITLFEAIIGIIFSIILAFLVGIFMDYFKAAKHAIYPLLIVTQTVPTIAVAPIIVLFFGYGILSKIILVTVCCFFPLTISIYDGFSHIDTEYLNLLRSMNANYFQLLIHLKIPYTFSQFFSSLKISATYGFISAVVAEWLGGTTGVGVYMTRVKSAYSFDKLFASILFVSLVSICFVKLIEFLQKRILKHLHIEK